MTESESVEQHSPLTPDTTGELCSAAGLAWLVEHVDNSAVILFVLQATGNELRANRSQSSATYRDARAIRRPMCVSGTVLAIGGFAVLADTAVVRHNKVLLKSRRP